MRRQLTLYLLALSCVLTATPDALASAEPTFTTIDFPGALNTTAHGINPRGDIVGEYTLAGTAHGFLLSGGEFTTIDFPGAFGTIANGINPRGDIVGLSIHVCGPRCSTARGFLLSGGEFTSFDFPGAFSTEANGINPRGDIVGRYFDAGFRQHGFLLSGDRGEDAAQKGGSQ